MDIRSALKNQYHASLRTLKLQIELCPDDLWTTGEGGRPYWRIVYHSLYYTHLYLCQTSEDFQPWKLHKEDAASLWMPDSKGTSYSKSELTGYLKAVMKLVDSSVDGLDLDAPTTGFSWYPGMNKIEHQLVNIRHIQHHIGQLSELLMAHGIDTRWIASRKPLKSS